MAINTRTEIAELPTSADTPSVAVASPMSTSACLGDLGTTLIPVEVIYAPC